MRDDASASRLVAALAGFFGAFGLLIAVLGSYGITAYAVSRRRSELAVRRPLGARSSDMMWLVVRTVVILTAAGMLIGLAGAALVARTVERMLFGVGPLDAATLVSVGLLGSVTLIATLVPAFRAAFLDPLAALRAE